MKLDITSVAGIIVAFATMLVGMLIGGNIRGYMEVTSVVIVVGGTIGALILSSDMTVLKSVPANLKLVFFKPISAPEEKIQTIVQYAEKARREGIISLDKELKNIDDDFTRKAVQLLVDGTDPELIKEILQNELMFMEDRHGKGIEFWSSGGQLAPAFGFLGTLIGLIAMLSKLSEPDKLGPAMAVALVTTLYGVILGNMVFLPFASKLKQRSADEVLIMELMIEGVMSIQSGDNPRIVEDKLKTFLAPYQRQEAESGGRKSSAGKGGSAGRTRPGAGGAAQRAAAK